MKTELCKRCGGFCAEGDVYCSRECDEAGFRRQNERRRDLIDKKWSGGLTDEEGAELARLSRATALWLDSHFPLPHERVEALLARLGAEKSETAHGKDL